MSGARRMYLHVSRALFDLPPDRRPAALAALASCAGHGDRLPGAVTVGTEAAASSSAEAGPEGAAE